MLRRFIVTTQLFLKSYFQLNIITYMFLPLESDPSLSL